MKKLISLFAIGLILMGLSAANAQTNAKLGYIDSQELISMMPGKDSVDTKLMAYQKELESTIQQMLTEYQNKIADYQANVATMSEIIKKTKEKEITDLETRIQDFQQNADTDFQTMQQQLYKPLLDKAKKAIDDVADANGYTYIFDASLGVLLYFEKGDNIMPLVKKELGL
ncbi:MAG: OmpH family outer membrane protein [Bacteroidales bacterium]|nr:OmpH family outer membrane protein [Bacteroidales bacterium]MCF8344554.1 OmpH family outer membrane protein [Bacteroidales bacterium]MCF8352243.1 OmpH family outer membrane protein [Bacteroidales bacterium]MCF8374766.1 OmpH family outer membrane protein [Bacteroidales bacterium]MCF8399830.1 OmpH family outer membrane protein [Bacteroidales bacterium]